MAYHFTAEGRGAKSTSFLGRRLARYNLIEFFPIEVADGVLTLGISIPLRSMDEPRLDAELVDLMTYLIVDEAFEVTDLFTGKRVSAGELAGLAGRIAK